MRPARLDGVQGRAGQDRERERGTTMTETQEQREGRTAADLPEQEVPAEIAKIDDVEEAMRDVVDPELGINVVDLGLVYGIHVDDANTATLDMTLTSAACPLTDVIEDQTRAALVADGGGLVNDVRINWVWMPPW